MTRGPGRQSPAARVLAAVVTGAAGLAILAPAAGAGVRQPATLPLAAGTAAGTAPAGSWTVYHGDAAGSGVARSPSRVSTAAPRWTSSRLDGQLYGEPLVYRGRVYVATERDTVYALSAATGAVAWSRHLATPVPAGTLPCGNITPVVGITGTPVIDPARGEIFVVADELVRGRPAHVLTGLAAGSGAVRMTAGVDPPGADAAALLQRTGLSLADGRVVFGFGGNAGDCPPYRGRVISVPERGGRPAIFTVDGAHGQAQGAVWMGGAAPAVDGRGHVWATSGNGSVVRATGRYDHSDAVLELSPGMRLLRFYAPATWAADNAADRDMSTEPALLGDGQVVAAGKQRDVYLLNGGRLGGIGHQRAILHGACTSDIDGGFAVRGMTVYLPCVNGIAAVRVTRSPASVRLLWRSSAGGGPPIVAAGLVWTMSRYGTLDGLDPATGQIRQQASLTAPVNHFPTPSSAAGLLLVPMADQVVAFGGAATLSR